MERLGDMIILKHLGRKYNQERVLVKCAICGKEREVSLSNLKKAGQYHTINTCRDSYIKMLIGNTYGDYVVTGLGKGNKIELECKICGHKKSVYENALVPYYHCAYSCKADYPKSFIGKEGNGFIVKDYYRNNGFYTLIIACKECGIEREIPIQKFDSYTCNHNICIKFLPHDKIKDSLVRRWSNINERCNNSNSTAYPYYGAKGIKNNFKDIIEFYNHFYDGLSKDPTLTIDRIDVNGDYCVENTRLVNKQVQQSNKTTTHYFIGRRDGKVVYSNNALEFGRVYGINGRSVGNCIRGASKGTNGWSFEVISKDKFFNDLKGVTTKGTIVQEVTGEIPVSVVPSI